MPEQSTPPVAGDETRDWLMALRWIAGTKTANGDEEGVLVRLGDLKSCLAALRPAPENKIDPNWNVNEALAKALNAPETAAPVAWFFRHSGTGVEAFYTDTVQAARARSVFQHDASWVETPLYAAPASGEQRADVTDTMIDRVRFILHASEYRDTIADHPDRDELRAVLRVLESLRARKGETK